MKLAVTRKFLLHLPALPITGSVFGLRYFSGELDDPRKNLPPPPTLVAASILRQLQQLLRHLLRAFT
ncbi:hypothetical protein HAX54_021097, partial [Datura stramonium]|nr:hypothetical protein [Datura stramonium]